MTTETAKDACLRIEDPMLFAAWGLVTRRAGNRVEFPVPSLVFFDIDLGVQPANECDGLNTGAKCPEPGRGDLDGASARA